MESMQSSRYVRLALFERMTGYTQKAVRRKIRGKKSAPYQ